MDKKVKTIFISDEDQEIREMLMEIFERLKGDGRHSKFSMKQMIWGAADFWLTELKKKA